jgi:hypothetical protein
MNPSMHEQLLESLRSGAEVAVIGDALQVDGSLSDARAWIIAQAQSDAFGDALLASVPDALKPSVRRLWDAWRRCRWPGKRMAIKRLRHVIRATTQIVLAFRQCLEAQAHA